MKFLVLVVALFLEQLRPLRQDNRLYGIFASYALGIESRFNGGQYRHGIVGWLVVVAPLVLLVFVAGAVLAGMNPVLGWAWNIAVLYLTMGFRQFSHFFNEIFQGLQEGRLDQARETLGRWSGESAAEFSGSETARVAIELGLIGSHRYVFGTLALFIAFGPAGAVLYRAAAMLSDRWGTRSDPEFGEFGRFAERFFFWLDWLPVRLTAASFAIVGNFEDAVYCWRTQAQSWAVRSQGILLASGGGALGVRLGDTLHQYGNMQFRPEMGTGDDADADHMQSTVGLIWRALVLWLFLVLLVTVARVFG